jgi:sarcosine oxidase subunit beta
MGRGQNRAAIGGIRATHSDPAKIRLCQLSLDLVQRLETEHGQPVDWFNGGYLFPVYDEAREATLKALLQKQKGFSLNIDWIGPDRVQELVPGLNPNGLRGGTFSPEDGSASPLKVALAYYALASEAGAEFRFNEAVQSFELDNGRIVKVATDRGSYAPGVVYDASGAAARQTGQLAGLDVPVYPDSHEAGVTEAVQRFFQPMVVDIRPDDSSANYYFYQNKEGQVVFCITPQPKIDGTDCDCTSAFLPLVTRRMVSIYPRLRNLKVRRTWRGLYPMTPDGFPIVGRPREIDNLMLAVGMCGQGFMLGPGLGQVLAESVVEDRLAEHQAIFDQLSLYRSFAGQETLK